MLPKANYQYFINLGIYAQYAQTTHNHCIKYCHIETTTLVTLANYCTIVALPVLYQTPLALVYLAVSLALVATKVTFMAKKSATVTCWMT